MANSSGHNGLTQKALNRKTLLIDAVDVTALASLRYPRPLYTYRPGRKDARLARSEAIRPDSGGCFTFGGAGAAVWS